MDLLKSPGLMFAFSDNLGWMFALSAMAMAGAALQEVSSLKQKVQALADELHHRGPDGPPATKR